MIRLRAFLSRLLRTNGTTLLVALFDGEIEVAIIDWRYALRLSVSRVVLVTALRIIDLTKSRSTACSRLKPTFFLRFR